MEDISIQVPVAIYNSTKDAAYEARVAFRVKLAHLKGVLESIPQYPGEDYTPTTGLLDGVPMDRFIIQDAIRFYERRIKEMTVVIDHGKVR